MRSRKNVMFRLLLITTLFLAGCVLETGPHLTARPESVGSFRVASASLSELDSLAGYYYIQANPSLRGPDSVAALLERVMHAGAELDAAYFATGSNSCARPGSRYASHMMVPPQLVLRLRAPWPNAHVHGFAPGATMQCRTRAQRYTPNG